jgi:hypothetical protein
VFPLSSTAETKTGTKCARGRAGGVAAEVEVAAGLAAGGADGELAASLLAPWEGSDWPRETLTQTPTIQTTNRTETRFMSPPCARFYPTNTTEASKERNLYFIPSRIDPTIPPTTPPCAVFCTSRVGMYSIS